MGELYSMYYILGGEDIRFLTRAGDVRREDIVVLAWLEFLRVEFF